MSLLNHPRFVSAMRILFWLALVFAVVMAVLPKPPELPIDRFGDKFAHILAFGTLAVPAVPTPGETTLTRSFSEGW